MHLRNFKDGLKEHAILHRLNDLVVCVKLFSSNNLLKHNFIWSKTENGNFSIDRIFAAIDKLIN